MLKIGKKLLFVFLFVTFNTGCTCLPGMENLFMNKMEGIRAQNKFCSQPIIIPITADLLACNPSPCYVYHIGRQDVLNITLWQHPEFDLTIRVNSPTLSATQNPGLNYYINANGDIYFPTIGYVHVVGKTTDQVRISITKRLKKYIRHPQVNVTIADYRSKKIYVLGEINKPGLLFLNDQRMSIMDALSLAGSIDPNTGDPRYIYVIRGDFIQPTVYWLNAATPDMLLLAEGFQLYPNDIIYVSTAIVTRWNRFLSQLLPTVQTIWYTKAVTGK